MSKYRLSHSDREQLLEKGYSVNDVQEIDYAYTRTTYTLHLDSNKTVEITRKEAEDILGHDTWLSGLSRSTFYIDATRYGERGEKITFHSKVYADR